LREGFRAFLTARPAAWSCPAQVGNQPLQLAVLLFQLPQAPQFRWAQPTILLLPIVERRIADTQLPADLFNRRAKLSLLQRKRYLLFGKLASLHVMTPFSQGKKSCRNSTFKRYDLLG
jgi:hypothetical protein